jgi:hypothetical protein
VQSFASWCFSEREVKSVVLFHTIIQYDKSPVGSSDGHFGVLVGVGVGSPSLWRVVRGCRSTSRRRYSICKIQKPAARASQQALTGKIFLASHAPTGPKASQILFFVRYPGRNFGDVETLRVSNMSTPPATTADKLRFVIGPGISEPGGMLVFGRI